MKNLTLLFLLLCALTSSIFAQTSNKPNGRSETPARPSASPQSPNDSSRNSNRAPTKDSTRQSRLPSFLGGGAAAGNDNSSNNKSNPVVNQTKNSSAPPVSSAKKPPVLVNSEGVPVSASSSPAPQTQSAPTSTTDTETAEDEVIKVETELVTIPVTVLDRQGRFMTGLQQADFKIAEDGSVQEIAYFNTTEQAFTVVLLLDVSLSTKFKIDEIQTAAIAFINQLKQNDRVMIISFDDDINVLSEPTSDRRQLYNAIRQAKFDGGTSLYDAVDFTINRRLNQIEGRKAIVLFTDGVDTTSSKSTYQSTLRDSEELDATVYPVYYNTYDYMQDAGGNYPQRNPYPRQRRGGGGIGDIIGIILNGGNGQIGGGGNAGGGTSRSDYERGEQYLEDIAARTGGRKYDADSTRNLETAFSSIAEELRRQYSLGYYPTDTGKSGQRKQIKVTVNRSGAIVRARDSYVVGEQKPNSGKQFGSSF